MKPFDERVYAYMRGAARPIFTIPLDLLIIGCLALTLLQIQLVLAFHMVFALLTVATIVHTRRELAIRAVIAVGLVALGVAVGVAEGKTDIDELYEIPILILMLTSATQALSLWRGAVSRVEGQQERLVNVYNASQIELRDQLLLAQRLDTMGRLSAGVVHNLNNVLTGILSLSERIEYTSGEQESSALAVRIGRQSRQGGGLLEDLLRFAKPREAAIGADLGMAMTRDESMLAMLAGPMVTVDVQAPKDPLYVATSSGRVTQMLVNLVLNARDALPSGGTIKIRADEVGRDAVLTAVDDGIGMDEETRSNALEAFFTTKPQGSGSGLGLYTLVQIAEDAGGSVAIRSALGSGTSVTVTLPMHAGDAVTQRVPFVESAPERFFGTEVVLLVEDDALIREQLTWSLELYGYTVHVASEGAEALQMMAGGLVADIVVSDVVMPGVGGPELERRMRSAGVTTPIVFMSAFEGVNLPELPDDARLLTKPFGRNELLAELRSILGGSD